jgi:hypothetical protein
LRENIKIGKRKKEETMKEKRGKTNDKREN